MRIDSLDCFLIGSVELSYTLNTSIFKTPAMIRIALRPRKGRPPATSWMS